MNISFKNRIALNYMAATAIIMSIAFIVVYFVVKSVVYQNIDDNLSYEAEKHTNEIEIVGDSVKIKNKKEWEEIEHSEVQVNPVFIQILNKKGLFMDKSPNLKENLLNFHKDANFGGHYNEILNKRPIRQIQIPIEQNGKIKGYIVTAMSLESSQMVLSTLSKILIITYLLLLLSLFFISKFIAGRSIVPVQMVIETTNRITKNNLNERVILPQNKDELYDLSFGINALLQRLENALERERQFTSDASHELRTPLASLKGTLEVLIRKPREIQAYEDKIKFSLTEIDRMSTVIDQLLLLARIEKKPKTLEEYSVSIVSLIDVTLLRYQKNILEKQLTVEILNSTDKHNLVPQYYTSLILDNLLSNAIKYAKNYSKIEISILKIELKLVCKIKDEGIGIKLDDLNLIFNHFFRSDALNHKSIQGNGLGLSIAKKAADAISAVIEVESEFEIGSTFTIWFND